MSLPGIQLGPVQVHLDLLVWSNASPCAFPDTDEPMLPSVGGESKWELISLEPPQRLKCIYLFIYFPGVLLNLRKTGFSFPVFGAR